MDRRQAQVGFTVESDVTLPASVTATIKYRNLVGQRYIALDQGAGHAGRDDCRRAARSRWPAPSRRWT